MYAKYFWSVFYNAECQLCHSPWRVRHSIRDSRVDHSVRERHNHGLVAVKPVSSPITHERKPINRERVASASGGGGIGLDLLLRVVYMEEI